MVNFGERLKELRKEAGLTQLQLANKLNVSKTVVFYYELKEITPSPKVIIKLSRIFNVTCDYLLGVEHQKTIDVSDLSDEDIKLLRTTIKALSKK